MSMTVEQWNNLTAEEKELRAEEMPQEMKGKSGVPGTEDLVKLQGSVNKLTEQLEYHAKKLGDVGVIGIACILMLAEGMRTANEVGIPARGVLLNFTGCDHWNDQPFASSFVQDSLKSILEEKYGVRD